MLFLFSIHYSYASQTLKYLFCTKVFPTHNAITKLEGQRFRTGYDNEVQVLSVAVSETKSPFPHFTPTVCLIRKFWVKYFHSPIGNVLACPQY